MLCERNKKERDRKDKVLQILEQFDGTYLSVSGKQNSLNLSIFLFCFVEKFQSPFNFESSLKFFQEEFFVEFSFSCLTW